MLSKRNNDSSCDNIPICYQIRNRTTICKSNKCSKPIVFIPMIIMNTCKMCLYENKEPFMDPHITDPVYPHTN